MIELNFLGIENVLLLRGDTPKTENKFEPEPNGNNNAIELIHQVQNMNKGIYLDNELENANHSDFCIGVAGYPEKHFEAPNMKNDMQWLKKKIDAGAQYIVTQMFFDNKKYFDFVAACRKNGITIPIIPGIKPITVKSHMSILPKTFHIDIPEELADSIEKCKTAEQVRQAGIEWSINQCKELVQNNVPVLHFYTMSKSEIIYKIAKEIY